MTLRQYYVGQALAGLAGRVELNPGSVADRAIEIADNALAREAK